MTVVYYCLPMSGTARERFFSCFELSRSCATLFSPLRPSQSLSLSLCVASIIPGTIGPRADIKRAPNDVKITFPTKNETTLRREEELRERTQRYEKGVGKNKTKTTKNVREMTGLRHHLRSIFIKCKRRTKRKKLSFIECDSSNVLEE